MEDDKTQEQGSYEGYGPSIILENEDEEVSSLYIMLWLNINKSIL